MTKTRFISNKWNQMLLTLVSLEFINIEKELTYVDEDESHLLNYLPSIH